jgi:predicted permease
MVLGAIIAAVLAIAVFFVSKFVVFSDRERVSMSALFAGGTCISTGGFIISPEVGFIATGTLLIFFSLLLAYENEGE